MSIDFCCGFGCEIPAAGQSASGAEKHWNTISGTRLMQSVITKYSESAVKFNPVAASTLMEKTTIAADTACVMRFYLYFETLPDVTTRIAYAVPNSGNTVRLQYSPGGTKILMTDGVNNDSGVVVVTGQFYLIDFLVTLNGTTAVGSWKVDGVAQGGVSVAHLGTSFSSYGIGWTTATTASVVYAELAHANSAADYPIGEGKVVKIDVGQDGTHSFSSGTFKYDNTTNISPSATDIYTYLGTGAGIGDTTGLISQNVVATSSYIEVGFDSVSETAVARAVSVVSQSNAAGTSVNKATLRLNDGGTLADVYAAADISDTGKFYLSKTFATPPAGGTWTQSKINALRVRWGYSSDVADVPFLQAVCLEVEYPVSGGVIYLVDNQAASSNHGEAQVGGAAPSAGLMGTGWTVGTVAPPNYSRMSYGIERIASTFSSTAQPSGAPDNSLGDCFRTANPLSGIYAAGTWQFSFAVRAVTSFGGQDGRVRVRVWRSSNPTGSGATEITSGAVVLSAVTNLDATPQNSTGSVSLPSITLSGEYLFFQVAWEITGAAS